MTTASVPHFGHLRSAAGNQLNASDAPDFVGTRESWKESLHGLAPGFSRRTVRRRFAAGRLFQPLLIPRICTETEEKQSFLPDFQSFIGDVGLCSPRTLATMKLGLFGCFLFREEAVSARGGCGFSLLCSVSTDMQESGSVGPCSTFPVSFCYQKHFVTKRNSKIRLFRPPASPPKKSFLKGSSSAGTSVVWGGSGSRDTGDLPTISRESQTTAELVRINL